MAVNFDFSSLSDEFYYSTGQRKHEDKQQTIDELERQTNSRLPPSKRQSNPDSSNNVHIVGDLFPGSEMPAVMFIFLIDLGLPSQSLSLDSI